MRHFDRSLIEDALPSVVKPVAHYTRIGSLCHFLSDGPPGWGSAWATPVQFLNDRQELALGLEVLQKTALALAGTAQVVHNEINNLLTTFGEHKTDAFQMSFSGDPDELGQWRGYAANGMGCCLVTDALELKDDNISDVAGWVLYDAMEQETLARAVLDGLRSETNRDVIGQALVAAASYMKHDGFRPEQEFRLLKFPPQSEVRFRETGDRLVPYTDYLKGKTPLRVNKIVIGPGWQLSRSDSRELARNHVVQGIQRLLTARGLDTTDIESSRIPYDPR